MSQAASCPAPALAFPELTEGQLTYLYCRKTEAADAAFAAGRTAEAFELLQLSGRYNAELERRRAERRAGRC